MKQVVTVSDEMTTLVGYGAAPSTRLPAGSAVFLFAGFTANETPALSYRHDGALDRIDEYPLVFVVARSACRRLFPFQASGYESWHLPNALKGLALSIIECEGAEEARDTLRLARSIELLCQIHVALENNTLLPLVGGGSFGEKDIARIAEARRMIDLRWHEKITIAEIARGVGVNRDKLVRGFRVLYGSSIAEILAERRLEEARRLLLASDLPVATVGYRCSYLNNASFTRAFTRRFGVAPSEMRRTGIAA
ncbi:helix-turn-helix domain-containing protein [Altererythrobacter luteolus]|uniref:Helix-turn-helix domain-containing protein n=1 Tax=Pontixanthobacter luteolus TaxID=295089 RepID=A0A6I4UZ36_9SPHN|nr:AraC family transcriptional regulator [Pontixanthobacter luteolus]MXP46036.1 helix-turn-helix domain-containing protein [Pontixanthobacter luteolus]